MQNRQQRTTLRIDVVRDGREVFGRLPWWWLGKEALHPEADAVSGEDTVLVVHLTTPPYKCTLRRRHETPVLA